MIIYLKSIQSGTGLNEKWVKLSDLAEGTSHSEKYLNLLARTSKLEAHKEGRVWVSSEKALEEYLQNRERKRKD